MRPNTKTPTLDRLWLRETFPFIFKVLFFQAFKRRWNQETVLLQSEFWYSGFFFLKIKNEFLFQLVIFKTSEGCSDEMTKYFQEKFIERIILSPNQVKLKEI